MQVSNFSVDKLFSNLGREIYHGERWRNDKRFLAPMCMLPSGCRVFVRDCIQFSHPRFGLTQGVVLKFMYEV